jgi:hypothetical protein
VPLATRMLTRQPSVAEYRSRPHVMAQCRQSVLALDSRTPHNRPS